MVTTYYFSTEEVKEALLGLVQAKTGLYSLYKEDFTIGFMDENDKNVDVRLVQIFDMDK